MKKTTSEVFMSEKKECKFDFDGVFNPEDYMYFYGDELTKDRTDREVAFLIDELEMNKPMSVLDVACGFGRHSIKLAEQGHHVTGIDCIEGFLCLAREQAQEKNLKINFIQKDMRYVEFNSELDRVILMLYQHRDTIKIQVQNEK
jgi:2-polyprenyl-3-methyl-5-hydroxy-6-metoxy-1,4-benzoquinol methylase